jgi:1-acyl-sn-glycerol-3-phosphate acyltransferase
VQKKMKAVFYLKSFCVYEIIPWPYYENQTRKQCGAEKMRMIRITTKWLGLAPLLLCYLFIAGIASLFPINNKLKRRVAIRITSFHTRLVLLLFGIRIHVKHPERLHAEGGNRLIIANHLSYVDVLVISSLLPSVFITSVELKHTPLLGMVARSAGSIFVERRKATGLKREIESIACVLGQGFPVILFPEGTTSNGDRVMQFKYPLFDAAVAARADIVPLCLRYTRVNNERLTHRNRDAIFYYGGVTFSQHFPRLLALKSIEVEILPLKSIKVRADHSRKDLAALTHEAISDAYHG